MRFRKDTNKQINLLTGVKQCNYIIQCNNLNNPISQSVDRSINQSVTSVRNEGVRRGQTPPKV